MADNNPNNPGYGNGYNPYNNSCGSTPGGNGCPPPAPGNDPFTPGPSGRCRGIAGLLAIFIGSLGIQYFYCGRTTAGVLAIVLSLCTCGLFQIIWLVQGIMMFVMSQAEFERKFVFTQSTFPVF